MYAVVVGGINLKLEAVKGYQDFIATDLHVHTPASKCYKGPRTDDEYFDLLRRFADKGVGVIAITDHNTFKGYHNLIRLRNELNSELKILEKYNSDENILESLAEKCSLFDKIFILPGVEFEASPGVHLLFIFDPDSDFIILEKFLEDAGYHSELQGLENPQNVSSVPYNLAIEHAHELGAIILAAHADSTKGIYNVLEGLYRAKAFKCEGLIGIQYTNPKGLARIKQTLQNNEYQRTLPLAYLQCTDYHGEDSGRRAGSCITYLKIKERSFNCILSALKDPVNCVSAVIRPGEDKEILTIAKDSKTINIESLNGDNFINFVKSLSALANSDEGNILLGVTHGNHRSIIGIEDDIEGIREKLKEEVITKFETPTVLSRLRIMDYSYGDRYVYKVWIEGESREITSLKENNKSYILKSGEVKEASNQDIVNITEQRLLKRMEKYQGINERKISHLLKEFKFVGENMRQFMVINKVENHFIPNTKLLDLINIEVVKPYYACVDLEECTYNGSTTGSVVVLEDDTPPRLDDAYLRITAPRFDLNLDDYDIKRFSGPALIVLTGGAIYYMESTEEWGVISNTSGPVLVVTVRNEFAEFMPLIVLLGWLKSSVNIWYCYQSFGSVDISCKEVLTQLPLFLYIKKIKDQIVDLITKIILQEEKFLNSIKKILRKDIETDSAKEFMLKVCIDHNEQTALLAAQIDRITEDLFGITDQDRAIIETFLDLKELFCLYNIPDMEYRKFEQDEDLLLKAIPAATLTDGISELGDGSLAEIIEVDRTVVTS